MNLWLHSTCLPNRIRYSIKNVVGKKIIHIGADEYETDKLTILVDPWISEDRFELYTNPKGGIELRQNAEGHISLTLNPEGFVEAQATKPSSNYLEVSCLFCVSGKRAVRNYFVSLEDIQTNN